MILFCSNPVVVTPHRIFYGWCGCVKSQKKTYELLIFKINCHSKKYQTIILTLLSLGYLETKDDRYGKWVKLPRGRGPVVVPGGPQRKSIRFLPARNWAGVVRVTLVCVAMFNRVEQSGPGEQSQEVSPKNRPEAIKMAVLASRGKQ